ncbi:DUF2188 domain-containing protein [Lysobacter yangpyeongensis]|uniref:DUF2188 domain-containing protein n=1 Tax=Lysobacter yangpyeongensis TaxID=346182 RepID=A0ABW0SII5_9GAMM
MRGDPMFWYYVAPYTGDKWNILFDNQPRPYIYDSEEEAIEAARKVAATNFRKQHEPSGVRVKDNGRWREDETYGDAST